MSVAVWGWRRLEREGGGAEAASDQEGAVRLRPAPPERRPLGRCAQLDAVGGSPWATRRRLLNLKNPLIAGSAAATCNFFASKISVSSPN